MKISVITINYNNINGLKFTIESVINQTSKDMEYIIIDGGSTDGKLLTCWQKNSWTKEYKIVPQKNNGELNH